MPEAETHEDADPGKPGATDAPREPFVDETRRFDVQEGAVEADEVEQAERRRKVDTDPALGPAAILGAAALSRGGKQG
jgi:hypothetical protein